MPLYEMIMITKCSQPAVAANILKSVTHSICGKGGNVREVKILADRYKLMHHLDCSPSNSSRWIGSQH